MTCETFLLPGTTPGVHMSTVMLHQALLKGDSMLCHQAAASRFTGSLPKAQEGVVNSSICVYLLYLVMIGLIYKGNRTVASSYTSCSD